MVSATRPGPKDMAQPFCPPAASRMMRSSTNITVPDDLIRATELAGQTAVLVGWDGHARGLVTIADTIKPTSADAIIRLRHWG